MEPETIGELIDQLKRFDLNLPIRIALRQHRGDLSYSIGEIELLGDGERKAVYLSTDDQIGYAPRSED